MWKKGKSAGIARAGASTGPVGKKQGVSTEIFEQPVFHRAFFLFHGSMWNFIAWS